MKKLLFIFSKRNPEAERLIAAAENLNIPHEAITTAEINLQFSDTAPVYQSFVEADAVLTRIDASYDGIASGRMREMLLHLYPEVVAKMLNGQTYVKYPLFSKLLQLAVLQKAGVAIPESFYQHEYHDLKYPVVVKGLIGSNGQQVHYVESEEQFTSVTAQYGPGNFLVQTPLPIGQDYRVIVLGNKVLGAHKKVSTTGFATNITAGGQAFPAEPERMTELSEIALRAASALSCEYGGVDVMYDAQGKPRVLEVNRAAGFNAMQENIWGIDLAVELLKYLQQTR